MKDEITKGISVAFESNEGPQSGTVVGVIKDLSNGQGFAVVEIDHVLPGCVYQVPLHDLRRIADDRVVTILDND